MALLSAAGLGAIVFSFLDRLGRPEGVAALPVRWLKAVDAYAVVAAAAVPLQAWLWRFPGAAATAAVLGVVAAALAASGAILWPSPAATRQSQFRLRCDTGVAVALAVALLYYGLASVAIGVRHQWVLLEQFGAGMWAAGYRSSLGLVAAATLGLSVAAYGGKRAHRRQLSAACIALAVATAAAAFAHWRWMAGGPGLEAPAWVIAASCWAVAAAIWFAARREPPSAGNM
ncbi:MAG: hypothetical protein H5T86_15120 [Armatimonadetes bacterium]|nr:hypothetical protein [Armatimonadota bacterium]